MRTVEAAPSQAAPTMLVFKDGRREQVHNYAIAGQTLWVFSAERARKVPVSQLDLDATAKANEDRGVEFRVPPHTAH